MGALFHLIAPISLQSHLLLAFYKRLKGALQSFNHLPGRKSPSSHENPKPAASCVAWWRQKYRTVWVSDHQGFGRLKWSWYTRCTRLEKQSGPHLSSDSGATLSGFEPHCFLDVFVILYLKAKFLNVSIPRFACLESWDHSALHLIGKSERLSEWSDSQYLRYYLAHRRCRAKHMLLLLITQNFMAMVLFNICGRLRGSYEAQHRWKCPQITQLGGSRDGTQPQVSLTPHPHIVAHGSIW